MLPTYCTVQDESQIGYLSSIALSPAAVVDDILFLKHLLYFFFFTVKQDTPNWMINGSREAIKVVLF